MTTRSGPNITEARRRELGYGTIKLRLPIDAIEMLEAEAHESGLSRAELVDSAIRIYCRADELAEFAGEGTARAKKRRATAPASAT